MLALDNAITAITISNIGLSLHILYAGQSHRKRFSVSGVFHSSQKWLRRLCLATPVTVSTRSSQAQPSGGFLVAVMGFFDATAGDGWASRSITVRQPVLRLARFLTMQAVILGMSGISELQSRSASPVHICCASGLKA